MGKDNSLYEHDGLANGAVANRQWFNSFIKDNSPKGKKDKEQGEDDECGDE